jgi:hypothetical protein
MAWADGDVSYEDAGNGDADLGYVEIEFELT